MSTMTREDVLHIATLANLSLTEDEVATYTEQLSNIVDHFEELSEVNIDNTLPTSQVTGLIDVTREDTITPISTLSTDAALSGTDKTENGYFVVDYVFEDKSI